MVHIWLRHETKPQEHRAALSPKACELLMEKGFSITVEKSATRCFNDEEYAAIGCNLVPTSSWGDAPKDAIILGLKELPEEDTPLIHTHILFGHCFKYQTGWKELLSRFQRGGGRLLDLEFLKNSNGHRVAAFGYQAGYAGAALGIDSWAYKHGLLGKLPPVKPSLNAKALCSDINARVIAAAAKNGDRLPKVVIVGSSGRCGKGAVDAALAIGIPETHVIRWERSETKKGGPFPKLLEYDIFVNCIYLTGEIQPFLTLENLQTSGRRLSVVVDVSCDYTSPHNPLPFYSQATYFTDPVYSVPDTNQNGNFEVDVIAIDHLPSMLPRDSTERYSNDLLPTLFNLPHLESDSVWLPAAKLFQAKVLEAQNADNLRRNENS